MMSFYSKYFLEEIEVGETKEFIVDSPYEASLLRRSAHNYNLRTDMYFTTRSKNGISRITRVR
jgi:hypothetical protein